MKNFKRLAITAIALVVFFNGCKKDDHEAQVFLCPLVVSTTSIDKAIDTPLNQIISVTFNEKMNPATINQESFIIQQGGTSIAGTVTYSGLTATFTPSSPLLPNLIYSGTIKTLAKDLIGQALREDFNWSFTTIAEVTLSSNPVTGGTASGEGTFNKGSSVNVTATPNEGYSFINWTLNETPVSTNPVYEFTMNGNNVLVANFTLQPVVGLSSNPAEGGTTTGGGAYNSGESVTVSANANDGYSFTNWTEGTVIVSEDANYTYTVIGNRELVANFIENSVVQFTVDLTSNPVEGGTTTGDGFYDTGAEVTVTATPNTGYTFVSWTEGQSIVSTDTTYVFQLDASRNLVANFESGTYKLNVTADNGNVLKDPVKTEYESGEIVILTATPAPGYTFTGWSDDATGSQNPLSVTMNADMNITANFTGENVNPAGINLGSAGNFAVLAGSGVANTGVSTLIIGDVGSFPTGTVNGLLAGNVNGILYTSADPLVGIAQSDLTAAYNDAQSRSLNAISLPGQLGGLTLAPGLYVNSSTSGISGTGANGILTLDAGGDANAVWIFKVGSTLVTDAGTSIVLAGGAQAKNIYWSVGTSATLGTNSTFYGNILADQSITLTTGATLNGRALTRIAGVTLDSNAITKP